MKENDILKSIEILEKGGTILYPTDTVWGIGCDATNQQAVSKIFDIKQRNESKSLIILVNSFEMLTHYVSEIPIFVSDFIKTIQNPTTIIYNSPKKIAKNAVSSDNSVAIRIVKDDFCQKLLEKFGKPIVSTSANISGKPTPQTFDEIEQYIIEKCDYVVKYKQTDKQIKNPSRLVKFDSEGKLFFLR